MITDPDILARMNALGIEESDLLERFIKGSGPGGQKINKTASCVFLQHRPTGIEVKCQEARSLPLNRLEARRRLCQVLEAREEQRQKEAARSQAKARFQKRRRSQRQKAKLVADKRHRSQVKHLRKGPRSDE